MRKVEGVCCATEFWNIFQLLELNFVTELLSCEQNEMTRKREGNLNKSFKKDIQDRAWNIIHGTCPLH